MHIKKASGKLMLSHVIVQLGQALVVADLCWNCIQQLSRWIARSRNLRKECAGETRDRNLIAGQWRLRKGIHKLFLNRGKVAAPLRTCGPKRRVGIRGMCDGGALIRTEIEKPVVHDPAAN